jgi:hypothetical protein
MIFGPKVKIDPHLINIYIDGRITEIVTTTKFLGVILDSNLTWKPHISYLASKIAKSIGILSIARRNLNQTTLTQLYHAFIYPYLSYCILIWGNSPASTLWPIYKLQKLSLRIITNSNHRTSTLPYCKKNNILRLPDIYTLNVGIFMFKFTNSLLPSIFDNLFTTNSSIHRYPTRTAANLRIPRVKTRLADSFITKTGVLIWNDLKSSLNVNTKLGTFKRALKLSITQNY